ncbi:hypothetical protein Scep_023136 [Stephania cephalantha]|uniref:Uncharacterized protein n=1 Tax=Stephania cephalantha TaxID=152367 RepID=A0AAP0HX07_9MAGN
MDLLGSRVGRSEWVGSSRRFEKVRCWGTVWKAMSVGSVKKLGLGLGFGLVGTKRVAVMGNVEGSETERALAQSLKSLAPTRASTMLVNCWEVREGSVDWLLVCGIGHAEAIEIVGSGAAEARSWRRRSRGISSRDSVIAAIVGCRELKFFDFLNETEAEQWQSKAEERIEIVKFGGNALPFIGSGFL